MRLFTKDHIYLDLDFESSDEFFDFIARKIEADGLADSGFAQSLKDRESNYPTGLPGHNVDIAVPHTDPKFIKKAFIAVVRTNKGVPFIKMGSRDEMIYPTIFFVLGFQKEGVTELQTKTLGAIVDLFLINDEGKGAENFMKLKTADECMEVLSRLEENINSN